MDDAEEGEEEGFSGFDKFAAFANPVQRKEKKGLDFTRWRDIMASGGDSSGKPKRVVEPKKPKTVSNVAETSSEWLDKNAVAGAMDLDTEDKDSVVFTEKGLGLSEISGKEVEVDRESMNDVASGFSSYKLATNEYEASSLESQIDAENRVRLGRMSSNEIAEAQAEIMAKMSPALIEALKKRGQDKLKNKKRSTLNKDTAASGEVGTVQDESALINAPALPHSNNSYKVMKKGSNETQRDQGNEGGPQFRPKNCSLWDLWSKRVESVREIRFSLDGSTIKSDFSQATNSGKAELVRFIWK